MSFILLLIPDGLTRQNARSPFFSCADVESRESKRLWLSVNKVSDRTLKNVATKAKKKKKVLDSFKNSLGLFLGGGMGVLDI